MQDTLANQAQMDRIDDLPERWRLFFVHTADELLGWQPHIAQVILASSVMAVAQTRIEVGWAAYINNVPGKDHTLEIPGVLSTGAKLDEQIARAIFPVFEGVPYCV